ncbi:helix-turn-helix domain-containing protein [Psychroflexus aestuariivivens]|uniref:helix-turn-helix domain-containing protein n=1 Tax=Psychroflexus aestuariivivens TaxID=1795040 RepID=UPI00130047F9|nr:AraC family transcriptional regulator [Psychroflexus aestuariivivens]
MNSLESVERYIKQHLNKTFSLQELADVACLSPIHFSRTFKKELGYSPIHYAELFKIRESLELIKVEDYKVQDIACLLGYKNYETFSRRFKSLVKIAPSDIKYLINRLNKEVDDDAPLIISGSKNLQDLQYLVNDALERKTFDFKDLDKLQVCILNATNERSRKVEERIHHSFETSLTQQLCELYYK